MSSKFQAVSFIAVLAVIGFAAPADAAVEETLQHHADEYRWLNNHVDQAETDEWKAKFDDAMITREKVLAEVTKERAVIDSLSYEFASCGAYYAILANKIPKYNAPGKQMLFASTALQKLINTPEMATKVTEARMKMEIRRQADEINGDFGNISILINQYSDQCKYFAEMKIADLVIEYAFTYYDIQL